MLRELADEIEEGADSVSGVALSIKRMDSDTLEQSIDVRGYGQFMTLQQTMLLLIDGTRFMADSIESEDEADDGTDPAYQE